MGVFKDKTFCASPNCKNACGRQMTKREEVEYANLKFQPPVCYAYFCGEPERKESV